MEGMRRIKRKVTTRPSWAESKQSELAGQKVPPGAKAGWRKVPLPLLLCPGSWPWHQWHHHNQRSLSQSHDFHVKISSRSNWWATLRSSDCALTTTERTGFSASSAGRWTQPSTRPPVAVFSSTGGHQGLGSQKLDKCPLEYSILCSKYFAPISP